ncbi:hypothetical protein C2845_PM06G17110 [Panicum miliaceum]|uniref:Uncharacterized protein n=1 Tax=Panicum miliaceum TaxID=4540 RepID=A0A3L6REP3_PANMI|nr:hypothetical protein C2845_PM06G17110 [Panicum miliaceum]
MAIRSHAPESWRPQATCALVREASLVFQPPPLPVIASPPVNQIQGACNQAAQACGDSPVPNEGRENAAGAGDCVSENWKCNTSPGSACSGKSAVTLALGVAEMQSMTGDYNYQGKFVDNLNKLLYIHYAEEQIAEHETSQNVGVKKRVWPVERHAMEVYTSKVYEIFNEEMNKSKSYIVLAEQDLDGFIVRHVRPDIVERYKRSEFKVQYIKDSDKYNCDCGLQEHVFIHNGVTEIPATHIVKRWTRNARDMIPMKLRYMQLAEKEIDRYIDEKNSGGTKEVVDNNTEHATENDCGSESEAISANRFGASRSCAGMSDDEVMRIKAPPKPLMKGRPRTQRYLSLSDRIDKKQNTKKVNVKDALTSITRHCRNCKQSGHEVGHARTRQLMLVVEMEMPVSRLTNQNN